MAFTRACSLDDLWQGEMQPIVIDGKDVLLVHTASGKVCATQATCPHQEFSLGDGELKGNVLTCCKHLWQFDVTTGKGINPSHAELALFPVRIDGDDVMVDVEGIDPKFAHS